MEQFIFYSINNILFDGKIKYLMLSGDLDTRLSEEIVIGDKKIIIMVAELFVWLLLSIN